MNNTRLLNHPYLDKTNVAFIAILGMFAGFLVSPAVLSMSMVLYGVSGLRDVPPRRWLQNRYWLLGVTWISFYAISWFWSEDKEAWNSTLQLKLPFLILPLAFTYTPAFSRKQLQLLLMLVGLFLFAGVVYSISFLIRDPKFYITEYFFSHLLPTPCRQDHISFSLSITLYIIWVVSAWPQLVSKGAKVLIAALVVILALYIHILAAKSGIVALYIFLGSWSLYLVFSRARKAGVLLLIGIPLFLLLAIKYIPTFDIRRNYVGYSFFKMNLGDKSGNYGDVNRLMSYKIALLSIAEHPLGGVGAGDIMVEMKKGYGELYPQVLEKDVLIPHNQFLIVGVSCGIPAMVIFAIWVFAPLTRLRKNRASFFFFITWLVLLFQLCIDTALEAQMCIFIFAFYFYRQKKDFESEMTSESLRDTY